jgi:hypothetical protein
MQNLSFFQELNHFISQNQMAPAILKRTLKALPITQVSGTGALAVGSPRLLWMLLSGEKSFFLSTTAAWMHQAAKMHYLPASSLHVCCCCRHFYYACRISATGSLSWPSVFAFFLTGECCYWPDIIYRDGSNSSGAMGDGTQTSIPARICSLFCDLSSGLVGGIAFDVGCTSGLLLDTMTCCKHAMCLGFTKVIPSALNPQ